MASFSGATLQGTITYPGEAQKCRLLEGICDRSQEGIYHLERIDGAISISLGLSWPLSYVLGVEDESGVPRRVC